MKRLRHPHFFNSSVLLFIALIVGVAAQQTFSNGLTAETARTGQPSHPGSQSQRERQIWEGDVLDLKVLGHPELDAREITVGEQGLISLPQIDGEIRAACLTVKELKAEILPRYGRLSDEKYQISLRVVRSNSPPVTFKGAVRVPSIHLRAKTRLSEVLAMAGGLTDFPKGTVEIIHHSRSEKCLNSSPGKNTLLTYKIEDIKGGGDEANPLVYPGDSITVPESERVYVLGAVVKVGILPLNESDTVSRVIDRAGGLSSNADGRRIEICRRAKGSNTVESFFVDIELIKRRQGEDVKLKPDDFIYVFFKNYTNGTCKNSLLGFPPTGISY